MKDPYHKAVAGVALFVAGLLMLVGGVVGSVTGTTSVTIGVDPVQTERASP